MCEFTNHDCIKLKIFLDVHFNSSLFLTGCFTYICVLRHIFQEYNKIALHESNLLGLHLCVFFMWLDEKQCVLHRLRDVGRLEIKKKG